MTANNKLKKRAERNPDLATALVEVAKAQADLHVPAHDLITRERLSKAIRSAQVEYLRSMGAHSAADAWEAGRQAA